MTRSRKILKTQGQTLLLALLIMAGVTAAGVGISTVVINQIRQSKNISDATGATYIAESALEKSLYIVKEERKSGATLGDAISAINGIVLEGLDFKIVEAKSEVQDVEVSVKENETYQIDLFDPDQQTGSGGLNYIFISWDNNHCSVNVDAEDYKKCFGDTKATEWAEVTWTSWTFSSDWKFGGEKKTLIAASDLKWLDIDNTDCPQEPDFGEREDYEKKPCYKINVYPSNDPNYRVRVRALYGDLDGLEIKALDINKQLIKANPNSWVVVKALGKAGGGAGAGIQQALQITAPWKVPMTGILNFTLLSEEDLDK